MVLEVSKSEGGKNGGEDGIHYPRLGPSSEMQQRLQRDIREHKKIPWVKHLLMHSVFTNKQTVGEIIPRSGGDAALLWALNLGICPEAGRAWMRWRI